MLGKRAPLNIVSGDTITKQQIRRIVQTAMPAVKPEDVEPMANFLTDGEESTTIGHLLMNVFVRAPYAAAER